MHKIFAGGGIAAAFAFAVAFYGAMFAFADSGTPPQDVDVDLTAVIDPSVELTLDKDDNLNPINFGNVTPIGGTYTQTLNATVKSNSGWTLKLFKVDPDGAGACTGDMTTGGAGCPTTLPSARLQWKVGAGAYAQITGTNLAGSQAVQSSGSATASTAVAIDYRLTVDWADAAGTYGATHTYTLTQP